MTKENNSIPHDATTFIGIDEGSPDGDCTVKGFFKNGVMHIKEIEYSKPRILQCWEGGSTEACGCPDCSRSLIDF